MKPGGKLADHGASSCSRLNWECLKPAPAPSAWWGETGKSGLEGRMVAVMGSGSASQGFAVFKGGGADLPRCSCDDLLSDLERRPGWLAPGARTAWAW
jgi:hypothetical protein